MDATLKRLHDYNHWATKTLLSHLENQLTVPEYTLKLMQHIINAESIWTSRICTEAQKVGVWEEHSLQRCMEIHNESTETLGKRLNSALDLEKEISYVNSLGEAYTDNIHDVLIHVFNHATYHRAQIAKDLRINGLEPINTDYILFIRQCAKK